MARRPKRTRLYLNNQISRSQALAHLAQNEITQQTVPGVEVVDYPQSEAEDPFPEHDEGCSSEELSIEGTCLSEDLPAGDSYPPEDQLHVMLGGDLDEERAEVLEDDKNHSDEDDGFSAHSSDPGNGEDDMIELDTQEQAMLDLLQLCQDAGTSLEFFDNLVTTLRRHGRKGFDIRKASKRQTFLDKLRKKISCPRPIITAVGSHQVPKFNLLEQIIDLLKAGLFDDVANLCVNLSPDQRFSTYEATAADSFVEVCASRWYRSTDQEFIKDHDLQFLLPLIFYIDETGTDAFQRYPLEPLMFTFAVIRRHMREKSGAWRHAGFVPKVSNYDSSLEGLQMYHECLSAILVDLEELQANPPFVELNLGGMKKRVRLILEVAFVMGDQKSQDNLCGRKLSNSGGAARIHRGCMCSFLHGSDSSTKCQPVSKPILDQLRDISFEDARNSIAMTAVNENLPLHVRGNGEKRKNAVAFIKRRSRLARDILGRTYTMHAIRNAFDRISFGTNINKIYSATLDDPLHFCNSGLFQYMGQVAYLGMQDKEREGLEAIVLSQVRGVRSSVRCDYPRGRYSKGFSNMTLLTADEKVGMNFTMLLALHNDDAKAIMEKAAERQQTKYMTFHVPKKNEKQQEEKPSTKHRGKSNKPSFKRKQKAAPASKSYIHPAADPQELLRFPRRNHLYFARESADTNFWPRTAASSVFLFHHLKKHGLSFLLEQDYDQLQLEYFFVESWKTLKSLKDDEKSYPTSALEAIFDDYPFHVPNHNPTLEPTFPIEEYYQDRVYKKPSAMVVLDDTGEPGSGVDSMDVDGPKQPGKEPELKPIVFSHLRKENHVEKHGRIKPAVNGVGNTTAILCDIHGYVEFLEISLCMHAYLHYSADLPDDARADTVIYERGMREFVRLFATLFYRGDSSVDTDTCKVHCFMHLLSNTSEYGDPMQYESGKGERGLKQWAKAVSVTAQKVGLDNFIFQTIMRVADRLLLSRASDIVRRQIGTQQVASVQTVTSNSTPIVTKRKLPHFRYYTAEDRVVSVDRRGKESPPTTKSGTICRNVLAHLQKVEKQMDVVCIWCEIKLPRTRDSAQPQLLRAHPNLDKFGSYFDWVDAKFDVVYDSPLDSEGESDREDEIHVAPAKLLVFYVDGNGEDCAIVHSVEWSDGTETALGNTRLILNYFLEFQSSGWPAIRKIKVDNIYRPLYVIERKRGTHPVPPKISGRDRQKEYVVSVVKSRNTWAEMFYWWAKDEVEPWPDEVTQGGRTSDSDESSL
jgi:hypothetical protein